ncbi:MULTISPECIES: Ger(x)C family spore germination protein [Bacillus cereus group]|nr:Ger(x)C family spore germination protein [Bacillus thuringiensis]MCQ6336203.1 Ger(x)C family spore germination protein [Bacillus cereus]
MNGFKVFFIIICMIVCCGCWDQYLMKDIALVTLIGFDQAKNKKIVTTASIPRIPTSIVGIGKAYTQHISSIANTPQEGRAKIDSKISGTFESAKAQVFLFGKELATSNLLHYLNFVYRNPKDSLETKLVIIDGQASQFLKHIKIKDETPNEYLSRMLKNAEDNSMIVPENIRSFHSKILDARQDPLIPYIKLDTSESRGLLKGLAMIHNQSFSGYYLNVEQAKLYGLMINRKGRVTSFTKRIPFKDKTPAKNFITLNIKKAKSKLNIQVKNKNTIVVYLQLNMQVEISELTAPQSLTLKQLENRLAHTFTGDTREIFTKMKQANCDGLGIGMYIKAFHPNIWNNKNGIAYSKIKFSPLVKIKILNQNLVKNK